MGADSGLAQEWGWGCGGTWHYIISTNPRHNFQEGTTICRFTDGSNEVREVRRLVECHRAEERQCWLGLTSGCAMLRIEVQRRTERNQECGGSRGSLFLCLRSTKGKVPCPSGVGSRNVGNQSRTLQTPLQPGFWGQTRFCQSDDRCSDHVTHQQPISCPHGASPPDSRSQEGPTCFPGGR